MKIIIKETKISLRPEERKYIQGKIRDLEKFINVSEDFGVEAFLEVGKTTEHHRKGKIFFAECQISLPVKSVRATAEREDLKSAVTEVKDILQRQLKKYKRD
jgi:ribosomal subunit interface protein